MSLNLLLLKQTSTSPSPQPSVSQPASPNSPAALFTAAQLPVPLLGTPAATYAVEEYKSLLQCVRNFNLQFAQL